MDGAAQYKDRIMRAAKFLFWASLFAILAYQIAPMVGAVLLWMAQAVLWIIATMVAFVSVVFAAVWLINLHDELSKRPEK